MRTWLRKCWPALKVGFILAILFFVGRQFYRDLNNPQFPELLKRSLQPGWLTLAGVLYLAGLGFSAFFWMRLLRRLDQRPEIGAAFRAYYLGHLGKYLPLKAWALLLRASLARAAGVNAGLAGLTALYEVLTTMTAGSILAAVLFWSLGHDTDSGFTWETFRGLLRGQDLGAALVDRRLMVLMALGLAAAVGLPTLPGVFNQLVRRLPLPLKEPGAPAPPPLGWAALGEGLILTACGWFLLGASFWAVAHTVSEQPLPFTVALWARYTGFLSLAYVLGFAVLVVPSGLGVREYFLTLFLVPDLIGQFDGNENEAKVVAVMMVLLLRLVWTTAEVIVAGYLSRHRLIRLAAPVRGRENGA